MQERGNRVFRFIDRYIGIPLVMMLGAFRRKKSYKGGKRIAILVTAGIGDTVLLTGIVRDLAGYDITVFTGGSNASMAKMIPGIHVIPLPITRPWTAARLIRKFSFDIWIDANPWPRINALFSFCAKASYKVGFRRHKQYRHYVYDAPIDHHSCRHEIDNLRALLKPIGIEGKHTPFVSTETSTKTSDVIALHLFAGGSRSYLKEWGQTRWVELIDQLSSQGYFLILTGSPADCARLEEVQAASAHPEKVEVAAGKLSLKETADLLASVAAAVSVDTGIMHLAAAVGCPLVSLHGPTSPNRWGAIGTNVIALQQPHSYTPCIQLGFESRCKSNACMQGIEVSAVLSALSTLLKTS